MHEKYYLHLLGINKGIIYNINDCKKQLEMYLRLFSSIGNKNYSDSIINSIECLNNPDKFFNHLNSLKNNDESSFLILPIDNNHYYSSGVFKKVNENISLAKILTNKKVLFTEAGLETYAKQNILTKTFPEFTTFFDTIKPALKLACPNLKDEISLSNAYINGILWEDDATWVEKDFAQHAFKKYWQNKMFNKSLNDSSGFVNALKNSFFKNDSKSNLKIKFEDEPDYFVKKIFFNNLTLKNFLKYYSNIYEYIKNAEDKETLELIQTIKDIYMGKISHHILLNKNSKINNLAPNVTEQLRTDWCVKQLQIAISQRKNEKQLKFVENASKTGMENSYCEFMKSWIYNISGNTTKALYHVDKSIESDPNSVELRDFKANLLIKVRAYNNAILELNEALKTKPENITLKKKIEYINQCFINKEIINVSYENYNGKIPQIRMNLKKVGDLINIGQNPIYKALDLREKPQIKEIERKYQKSILQKMEGLEIKNISVSTQKTILDTVEILNANSNGKYVVIFPGRGEFMEGNIRNAIKLSQSLSSNVILFNHRGVSNSIGQVIKFEDMVEDGITQVNRIISKGVSPEKIMLYGKCMGAVTATFTTSHFHKKGQKVYLFSDRSFSESSKMIAGIISQRHNSKTLYYILKPVLKMGLNSIGWDINSANEFKKIHNDYKNYLVVQSSSKVKGTRNKIDDGLIYNKASIHYALKSDRRKEKKKIYKKIKDLEQNGISNINKTNADSKIEELKKLKEALSELKNHKMDGEIINASDNLKKSHPKEVAGKMGHYKELSKLKNRYNNETAEDLLKRFVEKMDNPKNHFVNNYDKRFEKFGNFKDSGESNGK